MKKASTLKNSFVKKSVSMMMTAAVLFSFGTSAFAFNDTSDLSNAYQDAISKLSALEVVGGYDDGSYKPAANITRAEFAKIASVLSGMKDGGDYLQNTPSRFKDVKVSQWYTGWINVASSKGLLNGYPDGSFKPNQVISQQEVVTVLMRILGYNDNLAGPWPIDYINQATKLDVLEDVKFNGPSQANRGDVAVMSSSILDQKMVNFDKDTEDFKEKTKVLLEENFNGNSVVDEKVKSLDLKNADKKQLTLSIGGEAYTVDETTLFSTGFGVTDLKDHMVNVIFTKDSKGVKVAKFVEVSSTLATPEKIKLENNNTKIKLDDKSYPLASGVKVDEDITKETAQLFYKAFINEDGQVYKVIADKEDTEFKTGVVKEVKTNKDVNFFGGKISLKNNDAVIMKNGKAVELEAVQKYDVLKYNSDNSIIIVEGLKTGKLQRTYGDNKAVTIDGVKYPSYTNAFDEEDNTVGTLNDYVNTTVKYAPTPQGTIQTILVGDLAENSNLYGIVLNYTMSGGAYDNDIEAVTVFTQEGKTVKYNVKDNKVFTSKEQVKPGTFIKFRLNADGVIEKSLATNAVKNEINTADIKDGRIVLNKIKYPVYDDILAFNIEVDNNKVTAELVTAKEILADDISTTPFDQNAAGIQYVLNGSKLDVLVMSQFNSVSADKYGFVKDFGYDNGEFTDTIVFYGNSKEYELDKTGAKPTEKGFFRYTVSGDTVKLFSTEIEPSFNGEVKYADKDLFTLDNAAKNQFLVTADTMIAKIEVTSKDNVNTIDTIDTDVEINEGDKVYVKMNTVTDKTDEALYVIILEQ